MFEYLSQKKLKKQLVAKTTRYCALARLANIEKNKSILDCACGGGSHIKEILEKYEPITYVCADIDEEALRKCKGLTYEAVYILCADIRELKLIKEFDYYFCVETLEHLSEKDNVKVAGGISNLIKVGGYLLISVPGYPPTAMKLPTHKQSFAGENKEKLFKMFFNFNLEREECYVKSLKSFPSYNMLYVFVKNY